MARKRAVSRSQSMNLLSGVEMGIYQTRGLENAPRKFLHQIHCESPRMRWIRRDLGGTWRTCDGHSEELTFRMQKIRMVLELPTHVIFSPVQTTMHVCKLAFTIGYSACGLSLNQLEDVLNIPCCNFLSPRTTGLAVYSGGDNR